MKKILSAIYIVACLICTVCVPLSAIFVVCKLCDAIPLSWIECCVPLIISLSVTPPLIIAKAILSAGENRR